ncbi:MAG: YbaB/EbfC family nucleoid-associated protein [Nocardioidaceae bacterium]|nr:YbaB/EbfC family nucleoid-associated protein [Nocardioidaceae bacterium]
MFPEGSPDMQALFEQAAAMQQQLVAAQAELADTRVDGTAGGGLVRATVSGAGDLLALSIEPEACDPDDTETLADLVLAAVRDAAANAQQVAAQQLGGLTGGFGSGEDPDRGKLGF